jgi:hypothetical protein
LFAVVIVGAALVHMLLPGTAKIFSDYCNDVFGVFIDRLLKTVHRHGNVFDQYIANSLKAQTRHERGFSKPINVTMGTVIHKKIDQFPAVHSNYKQQFSLLAKFIV